MNLQVESKRHGIRIVHIDKQDFKRVGARKIGIAKLSNRFYAIMYLEHGWILLHRFILNASSGELVDHRDGNGLNNSRSNLRLCNQSQNLMNRGKVNNLKTSSKYKGVCLHKSSGKFVAYIGGGSNRTHIGLFDSEREAACAYDVRCMQLFGEFARTNFMKKN